MAWKTVPICDDCWYNEEGTRIPIKFVEEARVEEICYSCKQQTKSGIYVRRDVQGSA